MEGLTDGYNIAPRRVDVVGLRLADRLHNIEIVPVQMEGMLSHISVSLWGTIPIALLTGKNPGKEISMTLLPGSA